MWTVSLVGISDLSWGSLVRCPNPLVKSELGNLTWPDKRKIRLKPVFVFEISAKGKKSIRKTHLTPGHVLGSTSFSLTSSDYLVKTVFKIVTRNCQLKTVFNDKIVSTSFTPTSADNLLKHRHSDQLEKVLTDWPIVADWFLITRLRLLSSKFCLKKCLAWFSFFSSLLHTFYKDFLLTTLTWLVALLTVLTVDWWNVLPVDLGAAAACVAEIRLTHSLHGASVAVTAILPFPAAYLKQLLV